MCNLSKANELSPPKVREFLDSKSSCNRFTEATSKVKRSTDFAKFKNEIWCLELAYVDKLAEDNNGEKYLLVRKIKVFDRTVDAKGVKTKDSMERLETFSKIITIKNRPESLGRSGNKDCWRIQTTLQRWRNKIIHYNEWDKSCICRAYYSIPQNHFLSVYEGLWIQIHSKKSTIFCNKDL